MANHKLRIVHLKACELRSLTTKLRTDWLWSVGPLHSLGSDHTENTISNSSVIVTDILQAIA
jgi:hypothetical protein